MSSSNRRERQLAQARTQRRAAREAERERHRRRVTALVAAGTASVLLLGVVGFTVTTLLGDDDADTLSAPVDPATTPDPGAVPDPAATASPLPDGDRPVACGAQAPEPPEPRTYDAEPPLALQDGADYVMTLTTSCGEIVVDLLEDEAPRTVNSFRFLAGEDFFDGAPFSRITGPEDGFVVVQGGDQEGTGAGGPGYSLPDENLEGATYRRGTLAMANAGPGTGGSQFFLIGEDTDALGPQYTPFGQVESGLDVLDRILAVGSDGANPAGGGRPSERVFIEDLTVTTR